MYWTNNTREKSTHLLLLLSFSSLPPGTVEIKKHNGGIKRNWTEDYRTWRKGNHFTRRKQVGLDTGFEKKLNSNNLWG